MQLSHGQYVVSATVAPPAGWFHLTVMYRGDGKGLMIYYDGETIGSATTKNSYTEIGSSSGEVVLGRQLTNKDNYYASVMVDEVALWNNWILGHLTP